MTLGSQFVKLSSIPKLWKPPRPQYDNHERANSAQNDGWHRAKPLGRDARLELSELVRGADEDHVDGRYPPPHFVRRGEQRQSGANDDADHVAGAGEQECNK